MKKKKTLFPSQCFQQQCSVEFEIPVVLLRLGTCLLDCQETVIEQTGLPYATKIVKNNNYVTFFFGGDENGRPSVEMVNNHWRCKIAACNDVDCCKVPDLKDTALEVVKLSSVNLDAEEIQSVKETEDQLCNIKIEQALTDEILTTAAVNEKVADENKLKCLRRSKLGSKKRCKKSGKTKPSSDSQQEEQNAEIMQFNSLENKEKMEQHDQTSSAVGNSDDVPVSEQLSSTNRPKHKFSKKKTKRCKQEENTTIGCPGCTKFFDSMNKLLYHVRHSHKDDPDYNELKKKLEDLMYEHSSRSRSLLVQNCSICGRERRGITLLNHLAVWHADCKNYEQLVEEAKAQYHKNKLAIKLEREKYLFRQQTNVCPYCSKELAHRASYRKHVTYTCDLNPNRRPLFNCNTCGYSSPYADAFKRHQEQHGTGSKFVCDLCGKEYCNRSGLVVHQRDVHRITKKMPIRYHVCPECQQEFYCKNHYERHIRTHNDDRPMQCDLCGKQFKHLDHLNRHRREIHQNQYRYHCEKCGHGMAKLSYLKAHKCGRIRRAQSARFDAAKNSPNRRRPDTDVAKQTQSATSENGPCESVVYSELFTGTQDKPGEGAFVLGVYDPACSSEACLYQLSDGLQSLNWTQTSSAGPIADNSSSNGLITSLLPNL